MKPLEYLLYQFELEGIKIVLDDLITRISSNLDNFLLVFILPIHNHQKDITYGFS